MFRKIDDHLLALRTEGTFVRNFAVVFSGASVNVLLQMILTPVVARLYGPTAYGTFGVFNALSYNLAMMSTLMYEQAFVLPKNEKTFKGLLKITLVLNFVFTSVSFFLFTAFGNNILSVLNVSLYQNWIYIVPLAAFVASLNQILSNQNIRAKDFKKNAISGVAAGISSRLSNLTVGLLFHAPPFGLIVGDLIGKLLSVSIQLRGNYQTLLTVLLSEKNYSQLKKIAIEFKGFPLYLLPGNWVNMLSNQAPIFMLSAYFGIREAGFYTLVGSVFSIISRLFSKSMVPVFLQKTAETYNKNPQLLSVIVVSFYRRLLCTIVLPIGLISIFGDHIFTAFLGGDWASAGDYIPYIGVYTVLQITVSPMSSILRVLKQEKYVLFINIMLVTTRIAGLSVGIYFHDALIAIIAFSIGSAFVYLVHTTWILHIVTKKGWQHTLSAITLITIVFGLLLLFKQLI